MTTKQILYTIIIALLTSCDFKTSSDYNKEAEVLEMEGKFEEAIALLNIAIVKDPKNIFALINRGVDKSFLKDYYGAIEDYSKIIEIDSKNTLAFFNRGKNKKRLQDYIGAIADFDSAISTKGNEDFYFNWVENPLVETGFQFDVKMEEIRFERGISRYNIDSFNSAFLDFNFCIQNQFELSSNYYWRGLVYLTYGMELEGCEDLEKANDLGDNDAKEVIKSYCSK